MSGSGPQLDYPVLNIGTSLVWAPNISTFSWIPPEGTSGNANQGWIDVLIAYLAWTDHVNNILVDGVRDTYHGPHITLADPVTRNATTYLVNIVICKDNGKLDKYGRSDNKVSEIYTAFSWCNHTGLSGSDGTILRRARVRLPARC